MGQGAAAVLAARDRDGDRAGLVTDQPDVGRGDGGGAAGEADRARGIEADRRAGEGAAATAVTGARMARRRLRSSRRPMRGRVRVADMADLWSVLR